MMLNVAPQAVSTVLTHRDDTVIFKVLFGDHHNPEYDLPVRSNFVVPHPRKLRDILIWHTKSRAKPPDRQAPQINGARRFGIRLLLASSRRALNFLTPSRSRARRRAVPKNPSKDKIYRTKLLGYRKQRRIKTL
jgi:hypothetical protein